MTRFCTLLPSGRPFHYKSVSIISRSVELGPGISGLSRRCRPVRRFPAL
uniref:Uncharacterized protein n=1 Tax=Anguilla anguilla TaxID=7936 RepID=A0A0E9VJK1_ANGAN